MKTKTKTNIKPIELKNNSDIWSINKQQEYKKQKTLEFKTTVKYDLLNAVLVIDATYSKVNSIYAI